MYAFQNLHKCQISVLLRGSVAGCVKKTNVKNSQQSVTAAFLHSRRVTSFRLENVLNREPNDRFYHVLFPSSSRQLSRIRSPSLCNHRIRVDRQPS